MMQTTLTSFVARFSFFTFFLVSLFFSATARQDTTRYPLVLNFYSIGTGVPGDQPLKDYIAAYRKKNKLKPLTATRFGGLGREGEYAIVFPLTELNAKQKKRFITSLSKVLPTLKEKRELGGINLTQNESFNTNTGRVPPQKVSF